MYVALHTIFAARCSRNFVNNDIVYITRNFRSNDQNDLKKVNKTFWTQFRKSLKLGMMTCVVVQKRPPLVPRYLFRSNATSLHNLQAFYRTFVSSEEACSCDAINMEEMDEVMIPQ